MTSDSTDWHEVLARVTGALARGEQRVSTRELFAKLDVPVSDQACRRLRRVMRDLGWRGPKLMRWGRKTLKGYWRHPTVGLPVVQEEPTAEVATAERGDSLAPELEAVTRLALEKMRQILKMATDPGDGNILRAQSTVAALALNAQVRVDEAKLKQARGGDIMERILMRLREEQAKLVEEDRLERERKEGSS